MPSSATNKLTATKTTIMPLDQSAKQVLETTAQAIAAGGKSLDQCTPAEARDMMLRSRAVFGQPPIDVHKVEPIAIDGPHGQIPARLYRPADEALPGVLVYFHGGGFVIGDLDTHDAVCRQLAVDGGFGVLAVDYRLGPEFRFPAAVDDSFAAMEWIAGRSAELGFEPDRVAVGGDSAGGNLAAVCCLMARERQGPKICFQALLYPLMDMYRKTESQAELTEYVLTEGVQEWFQKHYLNSPADRDDWRASPLRAADHANLPPAFVMTAGYDPLRDEGYDYAQRLKAAGVAAKYVCFDGQIHGFLTKGKVIPEALEAINLAAMAVRRAFERA